MGLNFDSNIPAPTHALSKEMTRKLLGMKVSNATKCIERIQYLAFGANARDDEQARVARLMSTPRLQLGVQQESVVNSVLYNSQHVLVGARAGTGKTTTVNELMAWIRLWFQQRNQDVEIDVKSYHQFGLQYMRDNGIRDIGRLIQLYKNLGVYAQMDAIKFHEFPQDSYLVKKDWRKARGQVSKLLSIIKNTGAEVTPLSVQRIADAKNITIEPGWLHKITGALGSLLAMSSKVYQWGISMDDQIYWPWAQRATLALYPDLLIVDEYQDTSIVQEYMVEDCAAHGSRVVAVGDIYQAIFEFRGASSDSMARGERILANTKRGVITMPLTYTRRCPKRVVRLTNCIVPDFHALDDAPLGYLGIIRDHELVANLQPGDLVMCRRNADLVSLAYRLIRKGKPVMVRGREFSNELCNVVDDITATKAQWGIEGWPGAVAKWFSEKQKPLIAEGDRAESRLAKLQDQFDTMSELFMDGKNDQQVKGLIISLFSDEMMPHEKVTCSSIHKMKGGEAERVVIIRPDLLYQGGLANAEDSDQERNLLNVALTRSKSELYFVPSLNREGINVEVPVVLSKVWREILAEQAQQESQAKESNPDVPVQRTSKQGKSAGSTAKRGVGKAVKRRRK